MMTGPLRLGRACGISSRFGWMLGLWLAFCTAPLPATPPTVPAPQAEWGPAVVAASTWLEAGATDQPQTDAAVQASRLLARGNLPAARALLATVPQTPRNDLARGLLAELEGHHDRAAGLYRRARRQYPAEAEFRLGNLDLRAGRPDRAITHYQQVLRTEPEHALAHYQLAMAFEKQGHPDRALPHLDRTLALDPPGPQELVRTVTRGLHATLEVTPVNLLRSRALLARGRTLQALGRPGASEDWQACPDLAGGQTAEALWRLGQAAVDQGDVGAAALWLQAFLEASVEPTGLDTDLTVWGRGTIRVWTPEGRVQDVRSVRLAVDPQGRLGCVGGGSLGVRLPARAYGMQVDREGIVRVWQPEARLPRAVGRLTLSSDQVQLLAGYREREPGASQAWETLASLGSEIEQLVMVLPFLPSSTQVGTLAPLSEGPLAPLAQARLGSLYFNRFQSSRRIEDLHEARRRWQALRHSHPDLQFPVLNLATVALLERQFDEVTALLTGLRDAHPSRTLPDILLIQLLLALREHDACLLAADRLLQRTPNAPFPRLAKAEVLAAQDRKDAALAETEALLAGNPGLVEGHYLLVRLLGRQGNVQRQQIELERLLDLDPTPYRARRMLAALLDRLGQTPQALDLYRRYLATPEALVYETEEWVAAEVRVRQLEEALQAP